VRQLPAARFRADGTNGGPDQQKRSYRGGVVLDPGRALAWRLRRQALDPAATTETATEVGRRVLAIRGWPFEAADLAVCVRQPAPDPGSLLCALDAGEMIKSYAFRGGSYVFAPDVAALVLCVRTATRIWETRRWQQQGGFALDDWEPLREELCAALTHGPMTREEISARLAGTALAHLAAAATGTGADCLYKPLHWWGDICFGPQRNGKTTFRLLRGDPRWPGLRAVDDAGRELVARYLGAYGPATPKNLHYWFTEGLGVPRRRLQKWLTDLGDQVATLSFDGEEVYALDADRDELRMAEPTQIVRLLPAFDPWIIGPGMADARLVSPGRRDLFSHGASPVVSRGVVAGTWRLRVRRVEVSWFREAADIPTRALEADVQRLSTIRAQELTYASSVI
jgi:hypothetical protein